MLHPLDNTNPRFKCRRPTPLFSAQFYSLRKCCTTTAFSYLITYGGSGRPFLNYKKEMYKLLLFLLFFRYFVLESVILIVPCPTMRCWIQLIKFNCRQFARIKCTTSFTPMLFILDNPIGSLVTYRRYTNCLTNFSFELL